MWKHKFEITKDGVPRLRVDEAGEGVSVTDMVPNGAQLLRMAYVHPGNQQRSIRLLAQLAGAEAQHIVLNIFAGETLEEEQSLVSLELFMLLLTLMFGDIEIRRL